MVPFAATARGASRSIGLLLVRQRNRTGFAPFFEPIAFTPNVYGGRVVQEPVEDRGGDDRIAEDRTPFAVALVGSENDTASLVTGADELKEDGRAEFVQRQISHLIDDKDLGREVDAQSPVEPAFPISAAEIGHQIVRRHEV